MKALALRPDYSSAHNNLGSVLLIKGEVPEALKEFQEAVRLDPSNKQAPANLSEALKKKKPG